MAWVRVVPEGEAEGAVKEAYDHVRKQRGRVANVVAISSLLPRAMTTMMDFYLALMFGAHKLPRAHREMVAVEVSRANRCEYCVRHHGAALARVTKDEAFARQLMEGDPVLRLDARDAAMLAYARKLTLRPAEMNPKDVEALRAAGFDDEEIVAVNHIASYFNMMNRYVLGLGVELEPDAGADPRYKY
ncbi:MAG TPA: peroxidase-related enzyme [Candidatus Thermoplasmatota archaeon]|jgi:uncharacterized peroxidase-related enzyme|nr:peroxidase-related enzyme [Candidatus Thermoplasmatota archaeon]